MRKVILIVMSLALLMLPGVAMSMELVTNGDFQDGNFTGWTQSGDTGFTGVDLGYGLGGSYGAYFGPIESLGYIAQNLVTDAGETYDLTFWLKNGSDHSNEYAVWWDGNPLVDVSGAPAFGYTEMSFGPLTATYASTTLTFGFYNSHDYFDLDDVSVTGANVAAPEPATMLLLGLGLIGLAGVRRKFNN